MSTDEPDSGLVEAVEGPSRLAQTALGPRLRHWVTLVVGLAKTPGAEAYSDSST